MKAQRAITENELAKFRKDRDNVVKERMEQVNKSRNIKMLTDEVFASKTTISVKDRELELVKSQLGSEKSKNCTIR